MWRDQWLASLERPMDRSEWCRVVAGVWITRGVLAGLGLSWELSPTRTQQEESRTDHSQGHMMTTTDVQPQPNPQPPDRQTPGRRAPGRWLPLTTAPARITAAIAALLLLAGCTAFQAEDPPPTATRTATTTTAPPTPSPTPSAVTAYVPATADGPAQNVPTPVLPEKAKEFSKEGLEAFARHWYTTLGYAFETGNPGPMLAISNPDCKPCDAMKDGVTGGHADGKWIVGGQMFVLSMDSTFKQMPDETFQVVGMVRQQHVIYYNADSSVSKDLGVKAAVGDIVVGKYSDGRWTAVTVEHLQGSKK